MKGLMIQLKHEIRYILLIKEEAERQEEEVCIKPKGVNGTLLIVIKVLMKLF